MSNRGRELREISRELRAQLSRLRVDDESATEEEIEEASVDDWGRAIRRTASESSVSSCAETDGRSSTSGRASSRERRARARVDRLGGGTTVGGGRVRVDADMEVRLRRAELRKVDLELKLAKSFEHVEQARRALREAEDIHRLYEIEFAEASEEFEREQDLMYDELEKKERESRAEQIAAEQAAAIVRAEECRREADTSFKRGDIAEAEQFYAHAIAELEVSGITLVEPSHLWLRLNRATALFALGQARAALVECELVLTVDSGHIRALLRAAQCCLNLRELDKAQRYLEFVSLSPNADAAELKEALSQKSALNRAFVEKHKVAGNESFRVEDYQAAVESYTSALEHLNAMYLTDTQKVKVGLLSNRAAAFMMLGDSIHAVEDCHEALKLDPLHVKAQVRLARSLLQIGHFEEAGVEARDIFNKAISSSEQKSDAKQILDDLTLTQRVIDSCGKRLFEIEENASYTDQRQTMDFENMLHDLDHVSTLAPHASIVMTLRAEILRFMGDTHAAAKLVKNVSETDIRGLCIRARLAFELANVSDCLDSFKALIPALYSYAGRDVSYSTPPEGSPPVEEALKHIPNPSTMLQIFDKVSQLSEWKDKGKEAYSAGNFAAANSMYAEALNVCKDSGALQALFFSNICACAQATEDYILALASAGTACALAPKYTKAHARLAAIYTELDMVSDAQQTYESLLSMDLSPNESAKVQMYLVTIRDRVKAETPVNWRKLLNVGAKASKDDLKKKYRQLALSYHPDKAVRSGDSENLTKARAVVLSRLFNLINEAYNVLNDDNSVIKWENARVRAQYKCSHSCSDSAHHRSPFAENSGSWSSRYS